MKFFKINGKNQLSNKIDQFLKRNIRSKNAENKINILGDRILKESLIELKFFE